MKSSKSQLVVVCVAFLLAGTGATLSTKWQDLLTGQTKNGEVLSFEHPFLQTFIMFCGEIVCFVLFQAIVFRKQSLGTPLEKGEDFCDSSLNTFVLAIPAAADFAASTLSNIALTMTTASVYQMLRGSMVLFTAVLSYFFLGRRFFRHEYAGISLVVVGLTTVGVSSALRNSTSAKNPALGNILVVVAQLIQSSQFVMEERLIRQYQVPPLYVVGCEGWFGVGLTLVALSIFQFWPTSTRPDDVVVALEQMSNCWQCSIAVVCLFVAIPVFNGCAVKITKELSAATRMIVDALRNISVWAVTMSYSSYFHESFDWLQLVGFVCLLAGGAIYKELVTIPLSFFDVSDEMRRMLSENAVDERRERPTTETEVLLDERDSLKISCEEKDVVRQDRDSIAKHL